MAPVSFEFPVREWLNNGWILAVSDQLFWVGGMGQPQVGNAAEVWTPDFFDASLDKRELSSWSMQIGLVALETALEFEFKDQTLARSLVSWKIDDAAKETFTQAFELIRSRIDDNQPLLKKAVPWVFREGQTATSGKIEWLVQRIRFGLRSTRGSKARLYGRWNLSRGYLGLSPEDFVNVDGARLQTMAVAGTKTLVGDSDSEVEVSSNELRSDPKEQSEHQYVVDDLETVLKNQAIVQNVVVESTEVRRFRRLLHLVTPISAQLSPAIHSSSDAIWKLVEALHPTPALGTAPRDPSLALLRRIENFQNLARKGFGAPFAVKMGNRLESVVAIRQFRWESSRTDVVKIEVGSGCGIVKGSRLEKEWLELSSKRSAVLHAFGLSAESRRPLGWSLEILRSLIEADVRRFVVCAGARNAPLVAALDTIAKLSAGFAPNSKIEVDSFFEERSAAFFALGLAKASGAAVAVVTTSGTAVTELSSAMAEADFSGVPLIALTADRPRRLRSTGAPQSIDQNGIFARFSDASVDLEEGEALSPGVIAVSLSRRRPIHINLCFEEPLLIDRESLVGPSVDLAVSLSVNLVGASAKSGNSGEISASEEDAFRAALKRRTIGGGAAIVGSLDTDEREPVAKFILRHQIPCLLEATSGLRGDPRFSLLELKAGDRDLQTWIRTSRLAQVFRFGGVPTTRVWRDLDEPLTSTQTYSVSRLRFAGLGRGEHFSAGSLNWISRLRAILNVENLSSTENGTESEAQLLLQDQLSVTKLDQVLALVPEAEPNFVRVLSEIIPHTALVYVGNSLPVRWWDWVASRKRPMGTIFANRGVNGIDGQISTALGVAAGSGCRELWIVVGDLTALYDLSGLWAAKLLSGAKLRVVVINNSGGQIFREVLKSAPCGAAPFVNSHSLKFKNWAAMWGFSYEHCSDTARLSHLSFPDRVVLEIEPDPEATEKFWRTIE